jgi:hypothetical protein
MIQRLMGIVLLALLLAMPCMAQAQNRGQFCVRAYEDRNGNAVFDLGEPTLSDGVSVTLSDESQVILASTTLAESPNVATGQVCFPDLADGTYTLTVAAAEFQATTQTIYRATITSTSLPTVVDFGGVRLAAAQNPTANRTTGGGLLNLPRTTVERFIVASLSALVVMAVMVVMGVVVYMFGLRPRLLNTLTETATLRAVAGASTGPQMAVQKATAASPYARPAAPRGANVRPAQTQQQRPQLSDEDDLLATYGMDNDDDPPTPKR